MLKMINSRTTLVLVSILSLSVSEAFAQNTIVGPSNIREFVVNSPSFKANLNWSAGVVPTEIVRTVSFAGNHWAAYAGVRRTYKFVGETSLTGCSVGPLVVAAKAGCDPQGCNAIAHNDPCGEIIVWNANGTIFTMNPPIKYSSKPLVTEAELTGILVHELGHDLFTGLGDDPLHPSHMTNVPGVNDPCVMNFQTVGAFRAFCTKEILNIGRNANNFVGFGYLDQWLAKRTATGPTPSGWSGQTSAAAASGISGGELAFATPVSNPSAEYQGVATTLAYWPQGFYPPALTTDVNLGGSTTLSSKAFMRPAVVFDPTRNALWAFVREDGAGTLQNKVRVFRLRLGVSGWTDLGLLTHPTLNIESKYPVGVAYDPRTTNLLMVWSSSEGTGDFQSTCNNINTSNPNWLRHCRNEILAAILTPTGLVGSAISVSAVQRFALNPAGQFGYVGLGTPNVVCDPVAFGLQCEVYVVNFTQYKEIENWRICIDVNGFCGFSLPYSERPTSAGETDFPVALSQRRPDGSGRIMEVITGADQNVYWKTKTAIANGYGGWNGIGTIAIGPPSVRRSNVVDVYTLVYPVP